MSTISLQDSFSTPDYLLDRTQYLFNRAWNVQVAPADAKGRPIQGQGFQYGNQPILDVNGQVLKGSGNQVVATAPLRVTFDIEKNSLSSSNKAQVSIWNLSGEARERYSKGSILTLQAGYGGLFSTIFFGYVPFSKNKRHGPDIATHFEAGEGEKDIMTRFFERPYPGGTPASQIINDLLKALTLPLGVVTGLPSFVYSSTFIASGPIKRQLDALCAKFDLQFSIQNGHIQLIPKGSDNGDVAEVVNVNTGLIGVPSVGSNNVITFTSLLNPRLMPGAGVLLTSELTNGQPFLYKILKSRFEGDTHGEKWQVACECVAVGKGGGTLAQAVATGNIA